MSTGNPLPGTRVRIPLTDRPGDHAVVRVIAAPRRDLARAGRLSEALRPFAEKVVRDGTLITGQNPQSAKAVAEELVKRLKKS